VPILVEGVGTQAPQLTWLGLLPDYDYWGVATGVSADGSAVVGWAENQSRERRAFRWSAVGGMQNLGTLGGLESAAYGVSADGSVVVGFTRDRYTNPRAFRWTPARGMEDLNRIYYRLLYPGSDLVIGSAISPDGRYIVGSGYNAVTGRQEPFLLDTGFPRRGDVDRNGCVNEADLLRVLFAFGERGYRNEDIDWNGVIDDGDLLVVLFNVGNGC